MLYAQSTTPVTVLRVVTPMISVEINRSFVGMRLRPDEQNIGTFQYVVEHNYP